jgi:outer membrane biosynthesis protein TonB
MRGSGLFDVTFDTKTGVATHVKVVKSTGSVILDIAATDALWHWRARPGKIARLRTPVTFLGK